MIDPIFDREGLSLFVGDCRDVMPIVCSGPFDAVITDPPYEYDFMGRGWDRTGVAFDVRVWALAFAACKPGAHLLAFGAPRLYHRMASAIEDAGWEIRDSIDWIYGSGFPKSLDVSKAIDKAAGAERPVVGSRVLTGNAALSTKEKGGTYGVQVGTAPAKTIDVTAPATEAAKKWNGWGTALKPAHEPIVLARKPIDGTVAENVERHGTGAINVAATRIPASAPVTINRFTDGAKPFGGGAGHDYESIQSSGRWPANVVLSHSPGCRKVGTRKVKNTAGNVNHDTPPRQGANVYGHLMQRQWAKHGDESGLETIDIFECADGCPIAMLDAQSGSLTSAASRGDVDGYEGEGVTGFLRGRSGPSNQYGDEGGASRFFNRFEWDDYSAAQFIYCGKASTSEREEGLEDVPVTNVNDGRKTSIDNPYQRGDTLRHNTHPTVKPLALMRHLVRLVAPPGALILDPFAGTATTLIAAKEEGCRALGIELEKPHGEIARLRLEAATRQLGLFGKAEP